MLSAARIPISITPLSLEFSIILTIISFHLGSTLSLSLASNIQNTPSELEISSAADDISSSDGVLLIFDARDKDIVDPKWKEIIVKIIENSKDKGVILIGIRAGESTSWSQIIEELNVDEQLENKTIDFFFFRIGTDFRLDIFDQLKSMFSVIDEKY